MGTCRWTPTRGLNRRVGVALAGGVAALGICSSAEAVTYCVHFPDCSGRDRSSIRLALQSAASHSGADTVRVGQGTYPEGPLEIDDPDDVTVTGPSSRHATLTLTANPSQPPDPILTVLSDGARLRRLRFELTAPNAFGLDMRAGSASQVEIRAVDSLDDVAGVRLLTSTATPPVLRRSDVLLPASGNTVGVRAYGGATVSTTRVRAGSGVALTGSELARSAIRSGATGVTASDSFIQDTTIRPTGSADGSFVGLLAAGLQAEDSVAADQVTVAGDDAGVGVESRGQCDVIFKQADDMNLRLLNSIVSGFTNDLKRDGTVGPMGCGVAGGPPAANGDLVVSYSRYDPATVAESGEGTLTAGTGNTPAAARFVDPSAGDLRLRRSSPLIDLGSPNALSALESPVDLAGNPRIADGDGDGEARRDMGAYERPAP